MAFELIPDHVEAKSRYQSSGNINMVAGQTIKVETSPGGEEFISWTVPVGKTWVIDMGITVHEEDE
jgi:hypothetical protein